jgi:hypothetical protein
MCRSGLGVATAHYAQRRPPGRAWASGCGGLSAFRVCHSRSVHNRATPTRTVSLQAPRGLTSTLIFRNPQAQTGGDDNHKRAQSRVSAETASGLLPTRAQLVGAQRGEILPSRVLRDGQACG